MEYTAGIDQKAPGLGQHAKPRWPIWLHMIFWEAVWVTATSAIVFVAWSIMGFAEPGPISQGNESVVLAILTPVFLAGIGVVPTQVNRFRDRWIKEQDHLLAREQFAHSSEHDRQLHIDDMHLRALELLSSDGVVQRIGGLYNLEQIAQNVPRLRQVIVNEICAYMQVAENEVYEHVRAIANGILTSHLNPDLGIKFWGGIDINLRGIAVNKLSFANCVIRTLSIEDSTVHAELDLDGLRATGPVCIRLNEVGQVTCIGATFDFSVIIESKTFGLMLFDDALLKFRDSPSPVIGPHQIPNGVVVGSDPDENGYYSLNGMATIHTKYNQ